jgi:hypothetical protein
MHFITLFAFALALAGQGMNHRPMHLTCNVLRLTYFESALALNIVIGGSVGNVSASDFLTVQDADLTSRVRHSE